LKRAQRRRVISLADAQVVTDALPDAQAIGLTSGWPTPRSDVIWKELTLGEVLIFGSTPGYQTVQDYTFN